MKSKNNNNKKMKITRAYTSLQFSDCNYDYRKKEVFLMNKLSRSVNTQLNHFEAVGTRFFRGVTY